MERNLSVREIYEQETVNGKWRKGNALAYGQPGVKNPTASAAARLRQAMYRVVDDEEMVKLIRRHLELCYQTDSPGVALEALNMIFNRFLGKPKESLEVDINTNASGVNPALLSDDQVEAILDILDAKASNDPVVDLEVLPEVKPVHYEVQAESDTTPTDNPV